MSTVAPVPTPVGAAHRAQQEVGLREPSLGLLAMELGEVLSPLLGQSESVIDDVRETLEGQVLSRGQDRALLGQEGGLPGHPWREEEPGLRLDPAKPLPPPSSCRSLSHTLGSAPGLPAPLILSLTWGCPEEKAPKSLLDVPNCVRERWSFLT